MASRDRHITQERPPFTLSLLAQGGEFAFSRPSPAPSFGAIAPDHASLIGAVALSMLMGLLLPGGLDRVLLQRHATLQSAPQAQEI